MPVCVCVCACMCVYVFAHFNLARWVATALDIWYSSFWDTFLGFLDIFRFFWTYLGLFWMSLRGSLDLFCWRGGVFCPMDSLAIVQGFLTLFKGLLDMFCWAFFDTIQGPFYIILVGLFWLYCKGALLTLFVGLFGHFLVLRCVVLQ